MGKRVILVFSIIVAIVGFGAMTYFRRQAAPIPVWDEVAMTYGGVFCAFWIFDTLAKMVAKNPKGDAMLGESDAAAELRPAPRPRPQPGRTLAQQAVVPGEKDVNGIADSNTVDSNLNRDNRHHEAARPQLRLRRVHPDQVETLQAMLDDFVQETYALEERIPDRTADGHVTEMQASELLGEPDRYCFLLEAQRTSGQRSSGHGTLSPQTSGQRTVDSQSEYLAAVVAKAEGDGVLINAIFVPSSIRLLGVGSEALRQAVGFFRLLDPSCKVDCTIPTVNYRAKQFLRRNGFILTESTDEGNGTTGSNKLVLRDI